MIINILVIFCVSCGLFFFFSGAVGILRMPDFFTRLHPAGKLDSAGLVMMLAGMALYTMQEFTLNAILTGLKILLIIFFVFLTSPTATHAIMDAGYLPVRHGKRRESKRQKAPHDQNVKKEK